MRTALLTSVPLLVLACGSDREHDNDPPPLLPIEKTSALDAANRNFRAVVAGAARSGAIAEDHRLLGSLALGSSNSGEEVTMEDRANEISDDLAARILTIANVDVEEPTRIVLSLKPAVFCANTSSTATSNQSCTQALTDVPVRLELTSYRENDIDAALSVGPYSVATIQFYTDRFAVELDYGAAMDAAKALAEASGEPLEEIEGSIRGRVRLELLVNGPNDFTLALSILSPIDIDAVVNGEALSFDIGTSTPLASIRIDGNTPQLVYESDIGAIGLSIPFGALEISRDCSPDTPECMPLTGTLGMRIEATRMKMTIDSSSSLKIDRYSTGGASVTYNGMPILAYSINAGQPLSGLVAFDESTTSLSVSPMLDARAEFDFDSVVDHLGEDFPPALLRDTLQLLLNGAPNPTVRTRTVERTTVDANGSTIVEQSTEFEVVEGRLTLSSSGAGKTVTVEAGMCLDSIEPDPNATTEPHPFELLVAATCE